MDQSKFHGLGCGAWKSIIWYMGWMMGTEFREHIILDSTKGLTEEWCSNAMNIFEACFYQNLIGVKVIT